MASRTQSVGAPSIASHFSSSEIAPLLHAVDGMEAMIAAIQVISFNR